LKTEADRRAARPWPLAAVLTAYYAASAFLVVLLTTALLHWSIVRNMDMSDDRMLADRATLVRAMIERHAMDVPSMVRMVGESNRGDRTPQLYVRVLDSRRRVVAESSGMGEAIPPGRFPPGGDGPSAGVDAEITPGRPFRMMSDVAGLPSGHHGIWRIQVALDRGQEKRLLEHYRRNARFILGGAFILCVATGYYVARRGIRPIHDVTRAASLVRASNLDRRIESATLPAEFRDLTGSFNEMLARLQRSFDQLSRFSADIAHELRTPVNNLRGVLEVALERRRPPEEYEDAIGSGLEECHRLARLVDSLLFLARAEDPGTQIARHKCDLRCELEAIRDFFECHLHEAGLTVVLEADEGIEAELNRPLFQQAVGNLITNAIAHTPGGGTVSLHAMAADDCVHVEVSDDGCGISAEHLPHLFTRFFRADPSRTPTSGGVGLGLAIVKSVVDLHDGTVAVESKEGSGTRVRLTFPRATPVGVGQAAEMTES